MDIVWEYPLPTSDKSMESQYEAPVLIGEDYLYYATKSVRNITLHIVDCRSGRGTSLDFPQSAYLWVNPQQFFGFFHKGLAYYYASDLYVLKGDQLVTTVPLSENREFDSWLLREGRLYLAIGHRPFEKLMCIDLESLRILWTIDIGCKKNYRAGAISFFEGHIACYAQDQLLFVNPENGAVEKSLHLPRIDKLFYPIRQEDGTLLIGYTNWTNAGILRYDESTNKIIWRYKRKFEGPLRDCVIYPRDNKVYWVKNETELICLDIASGEEVSRVRTAPWLYSDIRFERDYLLFGSSGADGYLYCLDADNSKLLWTVPMKEGCSFFDVSGDSVYTGDYSKRLFRVSLTNGKITDELPVDGEVIGDFKIHNQSLYTVIWGNEHKAIRLVKIALS